MSVFGGPFEVRFQALAVGPPRAAPGPYLQDFQVTLRNTEPGHFKFYTIELRGSVVSTTWGKIGAAKPQSAVKALGSPAEALALANKTFREKSKGGYVYYEGDYPGTDGGAGTQKRPAENAPADQPTAKAPSPARVVSPMLAHSYEGEFAKVAGWLVSEKYDGIRAVWQDGEFWTRAGNRIAVPASLKEGLPSTSLDGELWLGFGNAAFNKVSGIVRSLNPSEAVWEGVQYLAFDAWRVPEHLHILLMRDRQHCQVG
jgi:predicted DNA-binding WGR domain protein